ncbi:MAG: hypothetical protein RL291_1512 [Pseudomonadota bacterium]
MSKIATKLSQRLSIAALLAALVVPMVAVAQTRGGRDDAYRPPAGSGSTFPSPGPSYPGPAYGGPTNDGPLPPPGGGDVYAPQRSGVGGYPPPVAGGPGPGYPPPYQAPYQQPGYQPAPGYGAPPVYGEAPRGPDPRYADQRYGAGAGGYGAPYGAPPNAYGQPYDNAPPPRGPRRPPDGSYSSSEIGEAGRGFFGSLSQGLASAVEYTFKRQGRPNGYILGEEAGGAIFGGLRYGEGILYTRDAGQHKVYWQGPSIGFDVGGEGNKVMILVYGLRDPEEIYDRFGGVNGSAYVVGGVGVTFQQKDHITLAPIRAGVGLRLGAAVGYLKYSRKPTWNPF